MKIKKKVLLPIVLSTAILASGCSLRPYEKPVFVDIEPNQTAFIIPLEGKTSEQAQFQSVEYLNENQVAAKRIQISRTWYKTGRLPWTGEYKDDVKVIVIDRTPVSVTWNGDSAFVGESKDSIKFNQGISVTAQVHEGDDSARFLYQYAGKGLEGVVGKEIKDKIGSVLLERYSELSIDEIRASKGEIIANVRKEVEPYFKEVGITLTNIGYVEDLKYLQADVQESINKDFKAKQEAKAQETINKKNEDQAISELKQAQDRQKAMEAFKETKELELKEQWIKKWDGSTPKFIGGESNGVFLNMMEEDKK